MNPHNEIVFEQDIVKALVAGGYVEGEPEKYDAEQGLYPEDLISYLTATQPEMVEKIRQKQGADKADQDICREVSRAIDAQGCLHSLRRGVEYVGAKFSLAQFKPDNTSNAKIMQHYAANILRVVRQVRYSPFHQEMKEAGEKGSGIIDLVIFLNGIPISTLELKTDFTQSVQHAMEQYKKDRKPFNLVTRKVEPLLAFNRRSLVHFAVSNEEVYMTTKLAGENTYFLPFNKGNGDASGNPPNPDGYATAYLWNEVLQKETLLRIIGRFMHLVDKDEKGNRVKPDQYRMIFPRYHQLDCVRQLINTAAAEGPGHNYLIQHSAGSGKSNSIAWLSHQLAALEITEGAKQGERLFKSVIVITDRTVLDSQLQDTIYQFEHQAGVVVRISDEEGVGSKSERLAKALLGTSPIIIVTIQTFPFVLETIREKSSLKEFSFAVIADEAHSSQTGKTSAELKKVLQADLAEDEEISAEDVLRLSLEGHRKAKNVSYFAFTATPKPKTLEVFGRLKQPDKPKSPENTPVPFHIYTMKQAIEEGFILDVLKNYITYDVAYKLAHQSADKEVDKDKAKAQINKWVRLHPHNISQKVQIIVEHFRTHVMHMLDGQAKAMVVTGSRKEAVRYKLAFDKYIKDQKYQNIHALVAFSGEVIDRESGDDSFTERNMNLGLDGRDLREAFDSKEYQVMIVANKFLTGFDQPKLCAMYVDKTLSGVEGVQTLSRLNRTYKKGGTEKDMTFILDFMNKAEDIKAAFDPFYKTTVLSDNSDPNDIFAIKNRLIDFRIFTLAEVEEFATVYYEEQAKVLNKRQKEISQEKISSLCSRAANDYRSRHKNVSERIRAAVEQVSQAKQSGNEVFLKEATQLFNSAKDSLKELESFKSDVTHYIEFYDFMCNIVDYESEELEKLYIYLKHLREYLKSIVSDDKVILTGLSLSHYKIHNRRQHQIQLNESKLTPDKPGGGSAPDKRKEFISKIIQALNDMFEGEFSGEEAKNFGETVMPNVMKNADVQTQIQAGNTEEQIMMGDYPKVFSEAVMGTINTHKNLAASLLGDDKKMAEFARLMLKVFISDTDKGAA